MTDRFEFTVIIVSSGVIIEEVSKRLNSKVGKNCCIPLTYTRKDGDRGIQSKVRTFMIQTLGFYGMGQFPFWMR